MTAVNPKLREAHVRALGTPVEFTLGHGPYQHVMVDCNCGVEPRNCDCRTSLYLDVIRDVANYFVHGLPCGGLATGVLCYRPLDELRRQCHTMVSNNTLGNTVEWVHRNLVLSYSDGVARVTPSQEWFSRTQWANKSRDEQEWVYAANPK